MLTSPHSVQAAASGTNLFNYSLSYFTIHRLSSCLYIESSSSIGQTKDGQIIVVSSHLHNGMCGNSYFHRAQHRAGTRPRVLCGERFCLKVKAFPRELFSEGSYSPQGEFLGDGTSYSKKFPCV